ncbi:DUF302 domain-containing protein [Clostridium grantii]|uniref:Uncharacterized conserved protein, DUF302 family n=1 Tax=Clostridium grantii DSM 8605 TaxID=1121316 RepID=A0A1M5VV64_9CLOT|nr:DUF302 domain-containing protein [Clostridium grantii]SHH79097.1 Uncharacterized conserved protein, DUF302 family [Clostridium grantii DSM 8605]
MDLKYSVKTKKTFEEATTSLKENLVESKFGVLWEMNFKDKLQEKGLDFNSNFRVMEVCNPPKAKEVLDKNIEIGFFLPCKLAVYEKDGETYIGMIKPTLLMGMVEMEGLDEVAEEVETTLKAAIDKTVAQ